LERAREGWEKKKESGNSRGRDRPLTFLPV